MSVPLPLQYLGQISPVLARRNFAETTKVFSMLISVRPWLLSGARRASLPLDLPGVDRRLQPMKAGLACTRASLARLPPLQCRVFSSYSRVIFLILYLNTPGRFDNSVNDKRRGLIFVIPLELCESIEKLCSLSRRNGDANNWGYCFPSRMGGSSFRTGSSLLVIVMPAFAHLLPCDFAVDAALWDAELWLTRR